MNSNKVVGRRVSSVFLYTVGTVLVFASGVSIFATVDLSAEFAVSIFGSIIGGFLGALLASIVVVDMYSRLSGRDQGR